MPYSFPEVIEIPPIPMSPGIAARQAVNIAAKIAAAGGLDAARAQAVAAILAATAADEPAELLRLRLLYQRAYSEAELNHLVEQTFSQLGLG